ncbi:methyl-accepting chemotaxis protein [Rhodobacter capsulatus]|uniref:methyl-accepting chemotaxis protein n=2 Tax=Rhodobacter capsulatus TaxID=1061 RepID=UPI0011435345|nr:methyl-accepting chemotaxis protein [Rhodobacter capsulatus]TQD32702.1 PAS domain-containing protein [Rhodobacter capsulatus]
MTETDIQTQPPLPDGLIGSVMASVLVLHLNAEGIVDFCSDHALEEWSIDAAEIIGQKFLDLIGPHCDFALEAESRLQGLSESEGFSQRFEIRLPNGRNFWLKAALTPTRCDAGTFRGVTITALDVSHAQRREFDIRTRLAAIENTQLTAEFMAGGMILSANAVFCNALGYDPSELVCEDARRLQDDAILSDADYAEFWSDRDAGLPFVGELQLRSKSGRDIFIQGSLDPVMDAAGCVDRIVLYATDVTERKTALNALSRAIALMKQGELEARIEDPFNIELEPLREDFNQMVAGLKSLVTAISAEAQEVSQISGQVAASAEVLQGRSDEQSHTLSQTLQTIDATARKIETTAKTASAGNHVAEMSLQRVTESGQAVGSVKDAMEAIRTVSGQINRFTSLINSIALQSRILGFNAAVEAARAGEAGRGFTIVANEVRSLATKTADAATEITGLVSGIEKSIQVASDRVTDSGKAIGHVETAVQELHEQMGRITTQCAAQSVAMQELAGQMGAMDRLTRDNRQMAQENQVVAAGLLEKSDTLMNKMSLFHLDEATSETVEWKSSRNRRGENPSAAEWRHTG